LNKTRIEQIALNEKERPSTFTTALLTIDISRNPRQTRAL
jgi:hypothetical protein